MARSAVQTRPARATRVDYAVDNLENEESEESPSEQESSADGLSPSTTRPRTAKNRNSYRESSSEVSSDTSDHFIRPEQTTTARLRKSARQRTAKSKRSLVVRQQAQDYGLHRSLTVSSRKRRHTQSSASSLRIDGLRVTKRRRLSSEDEPDSALGKAMKSSSLKLNRKPRTHKSRTSLSTTKPMQTQHPASAPVGRAAGLRWWPDLEYEILLKIFKFAAYPLYGPASRPFASISWLKEAATICRAFQEPALAALLFSPPLYPASRAQSVVRLLRQEALQLVQCPFDYASKVRHLDIEVKRLLISKNGISLPELISLASNVESIRLYSSYDDMTHALWAQPEAKRDTWSYPSDLFIQLDAHNIFLRGFEWNGRFPNAKDVLKQASGAHFRPSFQSLRHLTFMNISIPEKTREQDAEEAREHLRRALHSLQELRSLTFRNSTLLDDEIMPALPTGLEHLEIMNCPMITTDTIENYLSSAGIGLKSLKLEGNQTMALGFMANLKSRCPQLQRLEVDMLYADPSSYNDRDPLYDDLFPHGPPTWPTTLTVIVIENMRQLTCEDAEDVFDSLVSASPHLQQLKKLSLSVLLKNASWRDRAQLRQKWLPKLNEVFLSQDEPSSTIGKKAKSRKDSTSRTTRAAQAGNGIVSQGRCDTVELVISDQRPAETQFHEQDFLDSEPSDDGEYRQ